MSGNLLDVDPSIIENRLRIKGIDDAEEEFNKLFKGIDQPNPSGGLQDGMPWKFVTPLPGLCAKFFTLEGDKNFVNICHTREIPAPRDISDEELIAVLESEDASTYRVPMSISDPHAESDKSGNLTKAYDVAVNSSIIPKIENNKLFQMFFLTVTLEALQEKYGIRVNLTRENPYIILKNRKVLGPLRPHRIQQRDLRPPPTPLIQEVSSPSSAKSPSQDFNLGQKLKLERYPAEGDAEYILARVKIRAINPNDVFLDVGEDRLVLTAAKKNHTFVDIFLPYYIDPHNTTAEYDRFDQELRVRMPVKK